MEKRHNETGKAGLSFEFCQKGIACYCLNACLYAKCCNLIGWILELGPSIHLRIDDPDHSYGFQSKLKHKIFVVEKFCDGRETIDRGREMLVMFGKLSVNFQKLSRKT